VLESGIEIVARPPGKRPQNIMLLSGGEKALTAIALLFALFRIKPSPFCILDEADAPLDDANVLRFVHLLREMARETQFLIITHNKLTMEVANSLYGVTMEEKGISKLVAVELDTIHPEQELVSA
jgi:chromosome segregation protein